MGTSWWFSKRTRNGVIRLRKLRRGSARRHSIGIASCVDQLEQRLVLDASALIDDTPDTATVDGTIGTGEFVGATSGVGDGFGDVLGRLSMLSVDSSSAGTLTFGIQPTQPLAGANGLDVVVIYIDSNFGVGVTNTSQFGDYAGASQRAISGDASASPGDEADLSFAPGFIASHAITLEADFTGLLSIGNFGTLTLLAAQANDGTMIQAGHNLDVAIAGNDREWSFDLAGIGLSPGDSFQYIATVINSSSGFRAAEFQGVAGATIAEPLPASPNIGANPFVLSVGDFNTFRTVPPPLDYGDAPSAAQTGFASSYPVSIADNGAAHVPSGPLLGLGRDDEANGLAAAGANGDQADDGVTFDGSTLLVSPSRSYTGSVTVAMHIPNPDSNRLDAWIDFNQDGDWDDTDEQIFTSFDLGTVAGQQTLEFAIPAGASAGQTYSRFRLSSAGELGVRGVADDGEVEDYALVFVDPQPAPVFSGPSNPTNRDPFDLTIDFGEVVTGFVVSDLVVSNGTASNLVDTNDGAYTVVVNATSDGAVTIDLPADAVVDAASQGNAAADQFVVTVDTSSTLPVIASAEPNPTSAALIPVTVTFGEDVIAFDASDLEVSGGTVDNIAGSGANYSFEIAPAGDGNITVDIAARAATDIAGNATFAATQFAIISERLAPAAVITGPASPGNAEQFDVTVSFGETVEGFVAGDVVVTNGSVVEVEDIGDGDFVVTINIDDQGVVLVNVPADVAQDGVGNNNTAATEYSISVDSIAPTTVITSTETGPTNASVIPIEVTFSEDVVDFELADLNVVGGTVSQFSGSGSSYFFEVTPSADGTVTVDITADSAHDAAGNGNVVATQLAIVSDRTPPSPTISAAENPTNDNPITLTVSFGEVVSGFDSSEVSVSNAAVTGFEDVGAGVFTVTLVPTADGTIAVDIAKDVASDAAGNNNIAAVQLVITSDTANPTPVIRSTETSPSNNATIPITVEFDEPVVDFEALDVVVNGGSIGDFAGSDASYTFNITPNNDGVVSVTIRAGAATDLAGNASFPAAPFSITFDDTAPSVVVDIQATALSTSQDDSIVTLEFSEPIVGLALADLSATGGTLANLIKVDDDSYTVTFTANGGTEQTGSVAISGTYTDLAGNPGTVDQDTVSIDTARPTVLSIDRDGPALTNADSVSFVVTFDSVVSGIEFEDFKLELAGTVVTSIGSVSSATGTSVTVIVDGVSGNGILGLNFDPTASASVVDAAGNLSVASFIGQEFVIDNTAPTADIVDVSPDPRASGIEVITIQFSENVRGVEAADFTLKRNGASVSIASSALSGVDGMRTLDLAGSTQLVGSYSLTLTASGAGITDIAGNVLQVDATDVWSVIGGIAIVETDDATVVTELGGTDTFRVVLTSRPTRNVVLDITSNDTGEVTVSPSTLTFTAATWDQPQTVTVTGQSDTELADGDVTAIVSIIVNPDASDSAFATAATQTVSVLNRSHITSTTFVLNGTGRPTDFVDVISDDELDLELRSPAGQVLSPGGNTRVSLAGYPPGTYELWVNEDAENYTVRPNPGLGQATGDPPLQALDLDGNGSFVFSNDGILLLAYSLGMQGNELNPYRGTGERRTGREIQTVIEQLADALDFDGNGKFEFGVDGLMLLAYSLGSPAGQLAQIGNASGFRSGEQIVDRFVGLTKNARPREQSPDASSSGVVILVGQHEQLEPTSTVRKVDVPASRNEQDLAVPSIAFESQLESEAIIDDSELQIEFSDQSDERPSVENDMRDEFFSAADDLEQDLVQFI